MYGNAKKGKSKVKKMGHKRPNQGLNERYGGREEGA